MVDIHTGVQYRLLSGQNDYNECFRLQKEVFGFSNKDAISPALLGLFNRQFPKIGFSIGAFFENRLIGFLLSTSTAKSNSLYSIMLAVDQNFRNMNIGEGLFLKQKEICLNNNIDIIYFIYDPLEGNLANLYIHKLGMEGIQYESTVYSLENDQIPNDKILVQWNLESSINRKQIALNKYFQLKFPFENSIRTDIDKVMFEIPGNFIELCKNNHQNAVRWRKKTRELFSILINEKGFVINDFYSKKHDAYYENYYLLIKKPLNLK